MTLWVLTLIEDVVQVQVETEGEIAAKVHVTQASGS